ncbi:MAG: P-II family nitrogen regulator [Planctomycetota bacterium]
MKLVIAYIQPERLPMVKQTLFAKRVIKISVSNALGCGEQSGYEETYRGVHTEVDLLKKVRIEIAINDAFVDDVIDAIIDGARTGEVGDGKIFVMPLEECVRIRTGERGGDAIG